MASLALTVTSNHMGMITSSYVINDADLERVMSALRDIYTAPPPIEVEQEDETTQLEVIKYTNTEIWQKLTKNLLDQVVETVKNKEVQKTYEQAVQSFRPIELREAT